MRNKIIEILKQESTKIAYDRNLNAVDFYNKLADEIMKVLEPKETEQVNSIDMCMLGKTPEVKEEGYTKMYTKQQPKETIEDIIKVSIDKDMFEMIIKLQNENKNLNDFIKKHSNRWISIKDIPSGTEIGEALATDGKGNYLVGYISTEGHSCTDDECRNPDCTGDVNCYSEESSLERVTHYMKLTKPSND